jgi:two-component system OmpR family sensor kinase
LTDDLPVGHEILPPAPTQDAAPTSRRWRFFPRTLTARLVFGVGLLVVVVVALTSAATYTALRPYLTSQVDNQLEASAGRNMGFLQRCQVARSASGASEISCSIIDQLGPRGDTQWIQVIDGSGKQVLVSITSDTYKVVHLSDSLAAKLADNQTRIFSTSAEGVPLRATSRPLRGTDFFIVTAVSSASEANTLHRLLLLELTVGGSAVLLALLATAFGVRFSLRPLRRVSETAQAVTAELSSEGGGLDRRVPVTPAEEGTEAGRLAESMNTLLSTVETQFAARVESEQRMRQFLADASHELRTPLTSIKGYAELARMQRASGRGVENPADSAETLARIETEGNRMSRLVEDLLMLARGDQGTEHLQLRDVEMAQLVEDAAVGARAAYPARAIDVDIRSVGVVHGDHDQLMRVVRNLINNACLHTPGPVQVIVWRDAASVVIQVIDAGPGLPPDQAAHVFERFWRADSSRARSSGGTGLGLSIVATMVAAHGGTIRFDSDATTGSTVTVVLPAA